MKSSGALVNSVQITTKECGEFKFQRILLCENGEFLSKGMDDVAPKGGGEPSTTVPKPCVGELGEADVSSP